MGTENTLIKVGAGVLLAQNTMLILASAVPEDLLEYVFEIDLLGFVLLGIGLILRASLDVENKQSFQIAGAGFIGFVAMRIWWQFILIDSIGDLVNDPDADFEDLESIFNDMLLAFLLSGIFMMVGAYFLSKTDIAGTAMLAYGVVNLISVFMIYNLTADSLFTGILLKFLVVPILGIIVFLKLFQTMGQAS